MGPPGSRRERIRDVMALASLRFSIKLLFALSGFHALRIAQIRIFFHIYMGPFDLADENLGGWGCSFSGFASSENVR